MTTTPRELALLFLRLGTTAFGGPAAHIAMMLDEVVTRRSWMSRERFLDLLAATNLIPGPNSTELAMHIGWERLGWRGLWLAGACFIVPAMLITGACAWAYVQFGSLPSAQWLLYGIKPVILAVVVQAIWSLAPAAAKTTRLRILGAGIALCALLGGHELLLLLAAGLLATLLARVDRQPATTASLPLVPIIPAIAAAAAASAVNLPMLFWLFFKTGSVLFGSGYVLLAFLQADFVDRLHWLTQAQLLDAIAVGQITPGPVFTTATFIGYVLAGPSGALVSTLGIFLPAFLFVAASGPLVPRLRAWPRAAAFLDGVNVASLALMLVVTLQLGRAALVDAVSVTLSVIALVLLIRFKLNTTWLILGGALVGLLTNFAR